MRNYTKAQMNAPVTRGEFVHIFYGAEEAYKAINTVANNAIPDVKATDKFAAGEFYRAGILTGSTKFHSASTIVPRHPSECSKPPLERALS